MRKRNKFVEYDSEWNHSEWLSYCPVMEYRLKKSDEYPTWLPKSLTAKFNSAIVACSGNTEYMVVFFTGYRIDNDEIDEHPYVVVFDLIKNKTYAGFIEHANYPGRTTKIPIQMKRLMNKSGITVRFNFKRKPKIPSGSLDELDKQGLLIGFKHSLKVLQSKKLLS